jgi:acyl carrier protein
MDRAAILEQIRLRLEELVEEPMLLSEASIADDVAGWDSLAHVRLLAALEEDYDIVFEVEDITSLRSAGELVDLIIAAQPQASPLS